MQGEEALWEDYNNVAVLSQSLKLLKWMCAITEVLEGLAHCPRMRFLLQTKDGAGTRQSGSSTVPGCFQEHPRDGGLWLTCREQTAAVV